jgi:hypothetical protein
LAQAVLAYITIAPTEPLLPADPMLAVAVLLTAALAGRPAGAVELTKQTWDDAVAGKTVFVKFLAPW